MNAKVSLAEALEVRDGPLEESELWGVLCQAAEAIQDLFLRSAVEGTFSEIMQMLPITTGSLLLCCDGRICAGPSSGTDLSSKEFFPPEYGLSRNPTEEEVEKMFVYSLGVTLLASANFRLPMDQRQRISHELETLLNSMCASEPFLRATLFHVLRTCGNSRHRRKNDAIPSGHYVMKLYQLVLGSSEDVSCWSKESDQGDWSSPSEFRQQTTMTTGGSRSKVKSRSGSHNVNRQSHHQQRLRERPRTIGRDEMSDITRHSVQSDQFSHSHRLISPKGYHGNQELPRVTNDLIVHHVLDGSRHDNKVHGISTSKSKKHVQEDDAVQSQNWWHPVFHLHTDGVKLFSASTGNLAATETLEEAYNRLNRRRRKLDILRREVHFDGRDISDALSLGSDVEASPNETDYLRSMNDISNGHHHHHVTSSEVDRHLASRKHHQPSRQDDRNLLMLENEREKLKWKEREIEQWRKFQMQHLDPLVVDTSVWSAINSTSQPLPSGETSQNSATLSDRPPSISQPRMVNKKTGISSDDVFQTTDQATSLYGGVLPAGYPVGMSEFETSASVNSPMHDELSTNHESTPYSPQTLDLNSPLTNDLSLVRVHEYAIDSPVSFYETLPRSSLRSAQSQEHLPQGLNLEPVQVVESVVTPPVNEFLSEVKDTSRSSLVESKKLIDPGREDSETADRTILKGDKQLNGHQESVDVTNRTVLHKSSADQVPTKAEAPVKMPRKKSLAPVATSNSYGLSLHETVSVSPEASNRTTAKSEVPTKAPRKKSLTPVCAMDIYEVSNTETFSAGPLEASANGRELEMPHRNNSSTLDVVAASLVLPHVGNLVLPDEFRAPAKDSELDGLKSVDRCEQESQTDVEEIEDAASDISRSDTPVPVEIVTSENTPADSPVYTADYFISSADAPVSRFDPVLETPADRPRVLNVVESTVTVPDGVEVFTDSPAKMHANKNVELYVVTKPDNREVLTDSPVESPDSRFTNPDQIEIFNELPASESKHIEHYVVTKPIITETFTDPPPNMHVSQVVESYVLTNPGKTEVFTDSTAELHTSQNVEPYVVTEPDNNEIFTESPSRLRPYENVEQYVVTKPDITEVYIDTSADVKTSQNIEQYGVIEPNNTDTFSDSSSMTSEDRNVEGYVVKKPDDTEVFTESLVSHNPSQHDIAEPSHDEAPTETDLPQAVGQYIVTHPDRVEVLSDNVSIDSKPPSIAKTSEDVVQTFISLPNRDEVFARVVNESGEAELEAEVMAPVKAPRKSLKTPTPVQELVVAPVDVVDARSTSTVSELEMQPPPKAPRKLIRTGANDAPSPTMPPPEPPGSGSERTNEAVATAVLLPGAGDLESWRVEDGADSEVAALTARKGDETTSEDFRHYSPLPSSIGTGVDPGRSSRLTVEGDRGSVSMASEDGGKGINRREDRETLEPAVPKTWKRQDRIVGNKAPRQCYGPEFAHFNNQMATLIVPEAGGVQQGDLRHVLVVLLDGVHLDLICSVNSIGRHLYDCVTQYLTLPEQVFFGLVYVQGDEYFFLTADTKIHKVAPADWKKKIKPGQRQTATFVLYFRVKFYISDFDQLRHRHTLHLFYLQLRHDLLDESLHCSDELALALGSLAVQAEYGDWYERSAELDVDHYLSAGVVRRLGKMEAKESLLQQHSRYNGMPDAKAEWLLMEKCAKLPEYGLHFYKIFRSKNTQHETLLVGINLHGVILAEDQGNGRVFTRRHPWHTIYKISFNKHRFSIATKTATATLSEALVKFNYYTSTYKKGQYLVWLSTEHHRFRLLSRLSRSARSHSTPSSLLEDEYLMIDGASSAVGSSRSLNNIDEATDNEMNQNISRRNENNNNNDLSHPGPDSEGGQSVPERKQTNSQRERPVSFPSGSNADVPDAIHPQRYSLPSDPSGVGSSREFQGPMVDDEEILLDQQSNASSELDLEDVLPHELLHLPHSQMEYQPLGATDSQKLHGVNAQVSESALDTPRPRDPPPESSDDDVLDRNLRPGDRYEVILRKKENSFGINIAGGTNTNMKMGGVYVKSMTPGGAAERDGRIQVGDRILRVNSIGLVGASHRQAVEILRSSPPTSSLQLERCDPPSVTPSITSSWSSLARSELEVESMDTGIELKSKGGGNGKKMMRGRRVSVSESGINSEVSAYNGDMDLEIHPDSNNITTYPNIPGETRVRQDAVNQPGETDVARTLLNYGEEGVFANRAELRERMFPSRQTSIRRHTVSNPSSHPVSTTSSFQLPTSPRTTSEYNGDLDSSAVGTSIGHTSGQAPYNSDALEYEDGSASEQEDDDEEYEPLGKEHSESVRAEEDALGDYETLSEYFPQDDDDGQRADARIPGLDSEFDDLNRVAILKDIPEHLSADWLDTLPFISLAAGNQLYTGANLELMIQDLEDRLMRGEPPVEYKGLKQVKLTDYCLDGLNPDNKHKNRYRNILPYDKTRVKLSGPDDYINASHIAFDVGQTQHHYIAAQGPLPATIADFWRMIWEQGVDVVVMLTQEVEDGKVKCDRYWPELSDGPGFLGNLFRVTAMECHSLPNCILRFFQMDDLPSGASRLITHLNFTTWPDHNTPENGVAILRFIRLMHAVRQSDGPILAHCSAGVGRTGALLTIDICLAMMEQDLKFDIESIARELRRQRHGMIQTQDQYIFCYTTLLSALKSLRSTT